MEYSAQLAQKPHDDGNDLSAVLGQWTGVAYSSDRIEQLMAAHITRDNFRELSDVSQTKWWDYQRMAPGHAFMYFCHNYYKYFRLYANRMLAHKSSKKNRFILGSSQLQYKAADIWERDQRHITGMFRGMLTCDALYMPYDEFCRIGFDTAYNTGWNRLPTPYQLYSDSLLDQIMVEWDELKKEKVRLAIHPAYRVENYCDLRYQNMYKDWIVERISKHDRKMPVIYRAVYELEQMTLDDAYKHFSSSDVRRASILAQ